MSLWQLVLRLHYCLRPHVGLLKGSGSEEFSRKHPMDTAWERKPRALALASWVSPIRAGGRELQRRRRRQLATVPLSAGKQMPLTA